MNRPHRLLLAGSIFLGSLVCAQPVRAQARPAASGPGTFVSVGTEISGFRNPYGERYLGGDAVYVDVNPTWRYGLEAEARTLHWNSDEDVTMKDYLVGLRVSVFPGRLSPYGKFMVGAGRIDLPFGYAKGTFFTYAPGGGVDFDLNDRITIRAIDVEYQLWQNFPYGSFRPYGASVGLSFRLTPLDRIPKHAYYSRR